MPRGDRIPTNTDLTDTELLRTTHTLTLPIFEVGKIYQVVAVTDQHIQFQEIEQVATRFTPEKLKIGVCLVNFNENIITYPDNKTETLTATEYAVLSYLASHRGEMLSLQQILTKVWGAEYKDDAQFLRVWVSRLRVKLRDIGINHGVHNPNTNLMANDTIQTVRGIGYRLLTEEESQAVRDRRSDNSAD